MRLPARSLFLGLLLMPVLLSSGCEKLVKATDSQRIVGKWKGGMDSMEFFSNGDYRAYALLATWNGKWQIVEGNRLKVTMDSSLMPNMEWRYSFEGDKLKLTDLRGNVTLEYQKEK